MKKILLTLLIGTLTLTSCEETEVAQPNQNQGNQPPVNCNCGTANSTDMGTMYWVHQTTVTGNCGGSWSGLTSEHYSGTVCFGDVVDLDGHYVVW